MDKKSPKINQDTSEDKEGRPVLENIKNYYSILIGKTELYWRKNSNHLKKSQNKQNYIVINIILSQNDSKP